MSTRWDGMKEGEREMGCLPIRPNGGGSRVLVVVAGEAVELLFAEEMVTQEGGREGGVGAAFWERVDGCEWEAEAREDGF